MTPKEIVDSYFRELAEAERYRDKDIDRPEPGRREIHLAYMIGTVVYLKVAEHPVAGMVSHVNINPNGALYYVTWGDSRCSTPHYDIELTTERPL